MSEETRKYQAVVVLNLQGKDEGVDAMIKSIADEIEQEGAKLEQIDRIGKKDFPYNPRKVASGYYVNYHFESDPSVVEKVRNRLSLNGDIYMQHLQRASN